MSINKASVWSQPQNTQIGDLADELRTGSRKAEDILEQALSIHLALGGTSRWSTVILWDALLSSRSDLADWFLDRFIVQQHDLDGLVKIAAGSVSHIDPAMAKKLVDAYQSCQGNPSEQWLEGVALSHAISENFCLLDDLGTRHWDGGVETTWPQGQGDALFLATAMLAQTNKDVKRITAARIVAQVLSMGGREDGKCTSNVLGPRELRGPIFLAVALMDIGKDGARTALNALLDAGVGWSNLDQGETPGAKAIREHPAWRRKALGGLSGAGDSPSHNNQL